MWRFHPNAPSLTSLEAFSTEVVSVDDHCSCSLKKHLGSLRHVGRTSLTISNVLRVRPCSIFFPQLGRHGHRCVSTRGIFPSCRPSDGHHFRCPTPGHSSQHTSVQHSFKSFAFPEPPPCRTLFLKQTSFTTFEAFSTEGESFDDRRS